MSNKFSNKYLQSCVHIHEFDSEQHKITDICWFLLRSTVNMDRGLDIIIVPLETFEWLICIVFYLILHLNRGHVSQPCW